MALIPGYRPAVEDLDAKSLRGYLFDAIMGRTRMDRPVEDDAHRRGPIARAVPAPQPHLPMGLSVLRVQAFRASPIPEAIDSVAVQLNCPEHILLAFQDLLRNSRLLGTSFQNPYTTRREQFPTDVRQLTARHLQILARNEAVNTTGVMNTTLYHDLLNHEEIATIRCLVKATTVAGVTYATHTGGFPGGVAVLLPTPQKTIVIDQLGLQWQGDLANTGGLFFYPSHFPPRYREWQDNTYRAIYGIQRSENPSANSLNVVWNGVSGRLDLDSVAYAIEKEFSQALDAVVAQGRNLLALERINFKFLKAGMGFFASGLRLSPADQARLEEARLHGILQALRGLNALPQTEQHTALGKIGRIELPFSRINIRNVGVLDEIRVLVEALGLEWGGTLPEDVYAPRQGWVNAATNCGDPHAMIGNEGGYRSVDAAMTMNAYLDHLNVGFNTQVTLRTSPSLHPAPVLAPTAGVFSMLPEAGIVATEDRATPSGGQNGIMIEMLADLMANIREKKHHRATWFSVGTDSKTAKLEAISNWLHSGELTDENEAVILALIRDVCAIKRNYFGFHQPHSLSEFNRAISSEALDRLNQVNVKFTAKDLMGLENNGNNAINELIERSVYVYISSADEF